MSIYQYPAADLPEGILCEACGVAIARHSLDRRIVMVILPHPQTGEPTYWEIGCLPQIMRAMYWHSMSRMHPEMN